MSRKRLVPLLPVSLACALLLPALIHGQSLGDVARKTRAQRGDAEGKVWTNADFPSGTRPPAEEATAAGPAEEDNRSLEALFAELDRAREELQRWEETLEAYRRSLEAVVARWRAADNDYDRDIYRQAIGPAEEEVAEAEATVEELRARIAELEQLTAGKQRPAPREEGAEEAPRRLNPDEAEGLFVPPAAGPDMRKDKPEPPEAESPPQGTR